MAVFSSFFLILAKVPPSHFWPAVASQGGGEGRGGQPTQPRLAAARNTPIAIFALLKPQMWIRVVSL